MSARKTEVRETLREKPISNMISPRSPLARLCMALRIIEHEWRRIVGDFLAERSAPSCYQDGVLYITVENQAVLMDMNFKKHAIEHSIRTQARLEIEGVKISVGAVRRPNPQPARARRAVPPKPVIDEARLEVYCAEILALHADLDPVIARGIARAKLLCEASCAKRDSNFQR